MSPWCAKYILPLLECLLQVANHASERTPLDAANSALELPGNADQDDEIDLSDSSFATGNTIDAAHTDAIRNTMERGLPLQIKQKKAPR